MLGKTSPAGKMDLYIAFAVVGAALLFATGTAKKFFINKWKILGETLTILFC